MRNRFMHFLLLIVLMAVACSEKEEVVITHVHNATIKVSVYSIHVNPTGETDHIPIIGATVDLFETEYDRDQYQNRILAAYTDSAGQAHFYNLLEEYYYIRASHPGFGEALEETATPDGTVSFVNIEF